MKIEMGESLIYSWLRHIKKCQLVQSNWKVSPNWDLSDGETLENLKEQADKHYAKKYEYSVFKQNSSLLQLLHQGECDVLGISISPSKTEYYAVDVAFHEAGLNYGPRETTVMKVIEKCVRTALCLHGYFSADKAEIIFASPKISAALLSDLLPCIAELNSLFTDNGFDFTFRIIANDEYNDIILSPTLAASSEVSDTSELFLRSYQMLKMFSAPKTEHTIQRSPAAAKINPAATPEPEDYQTYPVGKLANIVLRKMLQDECASAVEIESMQTAEYSKKHFGIQYPLLRLAVEDKTPKHYYSQKLKIGDSYYRLCNEWFETPGNNDRPLLLKWIECHNK